MANFSQMASIDYHHGNLKEALIQAGDAELGRVGPDSLSLREIAKVAGVSHNAPYRHFKSKSDLVDSILERSLSQMAEQILAAPLLYSASLMLQIQYVGRLWAQLVLRQPCKARLLLTTYSVHHKILHLNLTSILETARGHELSTQTEPAQLAIILMSTFNGLGLFQISDGDILPKNDSENLYNLYDEAVENILRSVSV